MLSNYSWQNSTSKTLNTKTSPLNPKTNPPIWTWTLHIRLGEAIRMIPKLGRYDIPRSVKRRVNVWTIGQIAVHTVHFIRWTWAQNILLDAALRMISQLMQSDNSKSVKRPFKVLDSGLFKVLDSKIVAHTVLFAISQTGGARCYVRRFSRSVFYGELF